MNQTIHTCPCGKQYRLKPEMAGRKVKCKRCEKVSRVAGKKRVLHDINQNNEVAKRKHSAVIPKGKEPGRQLPAAANKRAAEVSSELSRQRPKSEKQHAQIGPPPLPSASGPPAQFKITKPAGLFAILAMLGSGLFVLVIASGIYSGTTETGATETGATETGATKSGAGLTDFYHSAEIRSKLKSCESHGIVETDAYYERLISTDVVVFDLLDGGTGSARRIDPLHLFMQFADKLDLYKVRTVILARNGSKKFKISPSELRRLSDSYAAGGRVAAFNNLPAAVQTMSGRNPYGKWSGGVLGVLQKQTEDLNDFIQRWAGY